MDQAQKIIKLLRLADNNSNSHETRAAREMAKCLMEKYDVWVLKCGTEYRWISGQEKRRKEFEAYQQFNRQKMDTLPKPESTSRTKGSELTRATRLRQKQAAKIEQWLSAEAKRSDNAVPAQRFDPFSWPLFFITGICFWLS